MKRLGMAVSALLLCATLAFAEKPLLTREPFVVDTERLGDYLQLTPAQREEVANINAYFQEQQSECFRDDFRLQDKKMLRAIYGNLKLMKKALTREQYRKYVMLINVTNNNNRLTGINSLPDVYLADNN